MMQLSLQRHDTFNLRALLDSMETYDSNGDSMLENGRGKNIIEEFDELS